MKLALRQESTVDAFSPSNRASALVPPNLSMISEEVMPTMLTEKRNALQAAFPVCVIYAATRIVQANGMLTTGELLARLDERGVRNHEIAKCLNISPSRVTELRRGERAVKLDEAVKLAQAFELEQGHEARPLPLPMLRLAVLHVARRLGVSPQEEAVADLAADLRAFSEFAAKMKVRESLEAAEIFFQAIQIRHPETESEARPGSDLSPKH